MTVISDPHDDPEAPHQGPGAQSDGDQEGREVTPPSPLSLMEATLTIGRFAETIRLSGPIIREAMNRIRDLQVEPGAPGPFVQITGTERMDGLYRAIGHPPGGPRATPPVERPEPPRAGVNASIHQFAEWLFPGRLTPRMRAFFADRYPGAARAGLFQAALDAVARGPVGRRSNWTVSFGSLLKHRRSRIVGYEVIAEPQNFPVTSFMSGREAYRSRGSRPRSRMDGASRSTTQIKAERAIRKYLTDTPEGDVVWKKDRPKLGVIDDRLRRRGHAPTMERELSALMPGKSKANAAYYQHNQKFRTFIEGLTDQDPDRRPAV